MTHKVFERLKRRFLNFRNLKFTFHEKYRHQFVPVIKQEKFSSKRVRQLFLDYFINEKSHTYVHSSPVFLNNDPTLLFVNAGMNQFHSLLLNKLQNDHPFSKLRRVANSQKCIRLSGKHNDLDDVGQDFSHHTFFEMLGNWSFGDYSKKEACEMAWELLTKVYNLNAENLYVSYFGGSEKLGIPADEDCKNIWLNIGVPLDHIFPFGKKENFWEMADTGPCGPCTEIHYDFLSSPDTVAKRINANKPDLIEIWNLVFIQYNKNQNGHLQKLKSLNVDTGMGFERLTAVLQGTMSNYDTDIFTPLFKAIEKTFNVRPYQGATGSDDSDGIDTAYRVIADHSRMFSVAIADGLFPDSYDAGHILRKIIRRAAYASNKIMKSRPGTLSSLVPVVAETLDVYPEINNNVKEIVRIVNDEEKLFHQLINRGRKARNKMMSESSSNILNGQHVSQLKEHYGLEEMVIKDLASEVSFDVDWSDYHQFTQKKKELERTHFKEKSDIFSNIISILHNKDISPSDDSFKYNYSTKRDDYGVETLASNIIGIVDKMELVTSSVEGSQSYIITDKTNFYSEAGGQVSDRGKIFNEDFIFEVDSVTSSKGYIFHHGTVLKGNVINGASVEMIVDRDHRLACSQNHTATHLLNSILRNILPYTSQRSSFVGPQHLKFGFSAKNALTDDEIKTIEDCVNKIIKQKLPVTRTEMLFEDIVANPKAIILHGEEYPEHVNVISVHDIENKSVLSLEPCCGTHVHNTSDIEQFIIIPSKSHGGSTRLLSAATGKHAAIISKNGETMLNKILQLQKKINEISLVPEELNKLLKEVQQNLTECHKKQDAPITILSKCEKILHELKLKLQDMIFSCETENKVLDNSVNLNVTKAKVFEELLQSLLSKNVPITDDTYKYNWDGKSVKHIEAEVIGITKNNELVEYVDHGMNCQLITDRTNFYSEEDDQAGDVGIISCKDFVFKVCSVYKVNSYVFHDGYVENGNIDSKPRVKLEVDNKHRLSCSQNHTALHLINAALQEELKYAFQLNAYAGPSKILLTFSSKTSLLDSQIENIEKKINNSIKSNSRVKRTEIPTKSLNKFPAYKLPTLKKSKDTIPTITIGDNDDGLKSFEPCFGTHVDSTADIGSFIIISSKSKSDKEKLIQAVTGEQAEIVKKDGVMYDKEMSVLEEHVESCLGKNEMDYLELWDWLKYIKQAKGYHETDLPLLLFRKHQDKLSMLSKRLKEATHDFVQEGFRKVASEMKEILELSAGKPYIVHKIKSLGDGKKIVNFALDNSQNKPALYFAQDGHKSIICSCIVPKHLVSSSFSALLWINPVASLLNGRARTLPSDPQLLYSVICPYSDKLDIAIDVAKEFAESNLHIKIV